MRSVRKTKSKYRVAKDRLLTHKGHGDDVAEALSTVVENAAYADVKVIASSGVPEVVIHQYTFLDRLFAPAPSGACSGRTGSSWRRCRPS